MSVVTRSAAPALLAAAVLAPAPAPAQDGVIAGRVVDTAGEALSGVTVMAVGSAPDELRRAATDLEGRYRIADLPPATYTVLFTLPGFRTVVREDIDVGTDLTATVDAVMVGSPDGGIPLLPYGSLELSWLLSGPPQAGAAALECEFRPTASSPTAGASTSRVNCWGPEQRRAPLRGRFASLGRGH